MAHTRLNSTHLWWYGFKQEIETWKHVCTHTSKAEHVECPELSVQNRYVGHVQKLVYTTMHGVCI